MKKLYKFTCGNVVVTFTEYSLEAAFKELEKRLDLASSCGVTLPDWLDFDMVSEAV